MDKNKTRNNQCCNGLLCKWHGNNTIGELTCECVTCGQLIHSERIKEGKICNQCSIDCTRTIPYGTVDNSKDSGDKVSNISSDDDIPGPNRGPREIIDIDDDNSFGYNYGSTPRTGIQTDFFDPVSDEQDLTYLDNEFYGK